MSPTVAGRSTAAATLAHAIERSRTTTASQGDSPALEDMDDAVRPERPGNWTMTGRPVSQAHVGPSRNTHSRLCNDPSNYLG